VDDPILRVYLDIFLSMSEEKNSSSVPNQKDLHGALKFYV
jgi:hypothetical protein